MSSSRTSSQQEGPGSVDDAALGEEAGYRKELKPRQIQMIALGGAIGTGLFLGAGGRLADAGPALAIVYAVAGFFAFLVLRALGELIVHRPSAGSFVSYAREFFGEKAAFAVGWVYWFSWSVTAVVDVTAVALYVKFFSRYWAPIGEVPQWLVALLALAVVLALNLVGVKVFGEMEFWFALVKVGALVVFLVVGLFFVVFGEAVAGQPTGFSLVTDNGGVFPNGLLPAVVVVAGVIFAYASIELLGTAAGETADARRIIPKAINTVIIRIVVFYVGSIVLLSLLLPYTAYRAEESPFVTFFSSVGITGVGAAMNLIVMTAALSSLNAGLYATGRTLRSMAYAGSAPAFAARISRRGVPYGGIALTSIVALLGVGLNAVAPSRAFEIVLNIAALGVISSWGIIVLCQIRLVSWSRQGRAERPAFRMFGAPFTGYLTLAFLAAVLVLIGLDYPAGTLTIGTVVVVVPALVIGWYAARGRIRAIAARRDQGVTGYSISSGRDGA